MGDLSGGGPEALQDVSVLRTYLTRALETRADTVVAETIALCLFAGVEQVAVEDRQRVAELALQAIRTAVADGALDARSPPAAELGQFLAARSIGARAAMNVLYLTERAALDEMATDDSFAATARPWPAVEQMVRRASFEVCAAIAEYMTRELAPNSVVDPLTTLHTRGVFVAALEREIQRCERFRHPFAMILFDVDHLSTINAAHGYGAGDRVLERTGIIIRAYFRNTDWVARVAGDTFAVLMPEIQGIDAERLADRVRITVSERLRPHDHRSGQAFRVTVSAGVVLAEAVDEQLRAEQLMALARAALDRAKQGGRNRVERAEPARSRD